MKTIQFFETTPQQLSELISEAVKKQLEELKQVLQVQEQKEELLTRKETCEFFQIDPSTLWHWVNQGRVKVYGIGNRRYFKRSELMESLTEKK